MTMDTNYGAPHIEPTKFEQQPVLRTLHDRVLIRRAETPEKIGSIVVPNAEPLPEGEVLSVGTKVFDVKVGDRVRFLKTAGTKLGDYGLIMYEYEIYGVLENGTIRPIGSKVLIKPDPPEGTRGLIILPDPKGERAKEQLVSGELVAMGLGMKTKKGGRWPMPDVKIGQRVLYFQNFTPELVIGDVTYVVVSEDQMRAVFE